MHSHCRHHTSARPRTQKRIARRRPPTRGLNHQLARWARLLHPHHQHNTHDHWGDAHRKDTGS